MSNKDKQSVPEPTIIAESMVGKIEDELKRLHVGFDNLASKVIHSVGMADLITAFGYLRDLIGLMRHGAPVPQVTIPDVVIPAGNLPQV